MSDRTTNPTTTAPCPPWCWTDHDAEQRGWVAVQEQTERYIREHPVEMRQAFGVGFVPPAAGGVMLLDTPVHEQEVGQVHVAAPLGDMAPVRVVLQQCGEDRPGVVVEDDVYTAAQARVLARLLVLAADELDRRGGCG